jgi:hypothetical protein
MKTMLASTNASSVLSRVHACAMKSAASPRITGTRIIDAMMAFVEWRSLFYRTNAGCPGGNRVAIGYGWHEISNLERCGLIPFSGLFVFGAGTAGHPAHKCLNGVEQSAATPSIRPGRSTAHRGEAGLAHVHENSSWIPVRVHCLLPSCGAFSCGVNMASKSAKRVS